MRSRYMKPDWGAWVGLGLWISPWVILAGVVLWMR